MSTLAVGTIKSVSSAAPVFQNTSGTEMGTLCRAWAIFSGTGTPTLADSFNVSSITDHGTGSYQVNFTTAFSSVNYAPLANCRYQDGSNPVNSDNIFAGFMNYTQTASQTTLYTRAATSGHYDVAHVYFAVFGD